MRLILLLAYLAAIVAVGAGVYLTVRGVRRRQDRKARLQAAQDAMAIEAARTQQDWTLDDLGRHRQRVNRNLDLLHEDMADGGDRLGKQSDPTTP